MPPLCRAAKYPELAHLRLLAAGADRTKKCHQGRLPLDYAEAGPHQQRFRTLLGSQR